MDIWLSRWRQDMSSLRGGQHFEELKNNKIIGQNNKLCWHDGSKLHW